MASVMTSFQPFARVEVAPPRGRKTAQSVFQCLIVSENPQRVVMFERAAAEGGWKPTASSEAGSAYVEARRFRFPLIIVDLEGPEGMTPEGYRNLTEQLARNGGSLLMVCGHDGDALEEIWARQFGAWLYLPGVDQACDLTMLCGEAQKAVKKLFPDLMAGVGYRSYARSA